MNKEEYFKISIARKAPMRCPILDYCMRRANTIYIFSDMKSISRGRDIVDTVVGEGLFPEDFRDKMIDISGELPDLLNAPEHGSFNNMCPEVSLFDSGNSLGVANGKAYSSCSWDYETKEKGIKSFESKHFTECAEYSKQKHVSRVKKSRKTISNKIRARLQKEISSHCPFCNNSDVEHFQIHHIDEQPNNNELENLIMLCPTCHSKITKGDITMEVVINIKSQSSKP